MNTKEFKSNLDDIYNHTSKARDKIVQERGLNNIDGSCHENAIYLCEYFKNNTEYNPYIRWGVVNESEKKYTEMKFAEHDGKVHFWVELNVKRNIWVMSDLFTMSSSSDSIERGDIFSSDKILESYTQLNETLFEYDSTYIKPHKILDYRDYLRLKAKYKSKGLNLI